MNYKRSHFLHRWGFLAGMLVLAIGLAYNMLWLSGLSLLCMAFCVYQTIFFCKCPHCKNPLPIRGKLPKQCPHCKGDL